MVQTHIVGAGRVRPHAAPYHKRPEGTAPLQKRHLPLCKELQARFLLRKTPEYDNPPVRQADKRGFREKAHRPYQRIPDTRSEGISAYGKLFRPRSPRGTWLRQRLLLQPLVQEGCGNNSRQIQRPGISSMSLNRSGKNYSHHPDFSGLSLTVIV